MPLWKNSYEEKICRVAEQAAFSLLQIVVSRAGKHYAQAEYLTAAYSALPSSQFCISTVSYSMVLSITEISATGVAAAVQTSSLDTVALLTPVWNQGKQR